MSERRSTKHHMISVQEMIALSFPATCWMLHSFMLVAHPLLQSVEGNVSVKAEV